MGNKFSWIFLNLLYFPNIKISIYAMVRKVHNYYCLIQHQFLYHGKTKTIYTPNRAKSYQRDRTILVPRNIKWWRTPATDWRCKKHLKSYVGKLDNVAMLLISSNCTRVHIKSSYVIIEYIIGVASLFQTRLDVVISIRCTFET